MALLINGQTITDEVLYREFDAIKSAYEEQTGSFICCEKDDEFNPQARQNVVTRILLSQEAEKSGPQITAKQVDDALVKLKEEHGGEDEFFAQFNITEDDQDQIRKDVELNLKIQQLLDDVVGKLPDPDDEQLRKFHSDHIDQYTSLEQVKASHILKSLQHGEDRTAAYQTLRDVRQQLTEGGDFAKLCKEHSDQPDEGGDLGFFGRGDLVDEFETVAFSMNVDEISPVFATPFGYHIAKLFERKPAAPIPFDDIADEVKEHYLEEERQAKVNQYVKELESKSTIEEFEEEEPFDQTPDVESDAESDAVSGAETDAESDVESDAVSGAETDAESGDGLESEASNQNAAKQAEEQPAQ